MTTKTQTPLSPVVEQTRHVPNAVQLLLYARAAGHCQFEGCKRDLTSHHVTQTQGNFAEKAHIVAFRQNGPRGDVEDRPEDINALENLMLLCPTCHKRIDDAPLTYPRRRLEEMKAAQEAHVRAAMNQLPEFATHVVTLEAPIGGRAVRFDPHDIRRALLPRYPDSQDWTRIDLHALAAQGEGLPFYQAGVAEIRSKLRRLHDFDGALAGVRHLSVFGLAPIPLLIEFGARLTDKVTVDLFQKHRAPSETWAWQEGEAPVDYRHEIVRDNGAEAPVALLLSLSGMVDRTELPEPVRDTASIYELTLKDRAPDRNFLKSRADLARFTERFIAVLAEIAARHSQARTVHLFPAVPAPVAIAIGRARLPKASGAFCVYDRQPDIAGYRLALEVSHDPE